MDTTGVAYPMDQRPAGSRAPKVKHLETKTGLGEKSPGTATVPSGDAAPKAIGAETVPTAASIPGAESDPSTSMAYRYRRDGSGRRATGDDVSTPRPRNRCPPASTDLARTRLGLPRPLPGTRAPAGAISGPGGSDGGALSPHPLPVLSPRGRSGGGGDRQGRAMAEALQKKLQGELEKYQQLQKDLSKCMTSRQKLEAQLTENNIVKEELDLLDSSNSVYKLIGPVLVKQDTEEAKATVGKRLDYIAGEIKRYEAQMQEYEKKSEQQREGLARLQQEFQKTQAKGAVKA
ncbi:UNVERIFIED_CONTAM: hypothetical protein K2H54_066926 [Gekko kuhli]